MKELTKMEFTKKQENRSRNGRGLKRRVGEDLRQFWKAILEIIGKFVVQGGLVVRKDEKENEKIEES